MYAMKIEDVKVKLAPSEYQNSANRLNDDNLGEYNYSDSDIDDEQQHTLPLEAYILKQMEGQKGFPSLMYFEQTPSANYMVISLLWKNMKEIFKYFDNSLSLQTVFLVGSQILSRLECLHKFGYIHRDLKPENIMVQNDSQSNTNEAKLVTIIDFGLAQSYLKKDKKTHIMARKKVGFIGTPRYISLNAHLGQQQSRRDDLESLGYVLVNLAKKTLPWYDIQGASLEQLNELVAKKKCSVSIHDLCKDMPNEMVQYFQYVMNLGFKETPNYQFLKSLFKTCILRINNSNEFYFDWQLLQYQSQQQNQQTQHVIKIAKNNISNNSNSDINKQLKYQSVLQQQKIQQTQKKNEIKNEIDNQNFSKIHKFEKNYRQMSIYSSSLIVDSSNSSDAFSFYYNNCQIDKKLQDQLLQQNNKISYFKKFTLIEENNEQINQDNQIFNTENIDEEKLFGENNDQYDKEAVVEQEQQICGVKYFVCNSNHTEIFEELPQSQQQQHQQDITNQNFKKIEPRNSSEILKDNQNPQLYQYTQSTSSTIKKKKQNTQQQIQLQEEQDVDEFLLSNSQYSVHTLTENMTKSIYFKKNVLSNVTIQETNSEEFTSDKDSFLYNQISSLQNVNISSTSIQDMGNQKEMKNNINPQKKSSISQKMNSINQTTFNVKSINKLC